MTGQVALLPLHPLCSIFPKPTNEELAELVEDIKAHGQLEPIVLLDGKVLDGQCRQIACSKLDREPVIREFDPETDGSPVDFVVSKNLMRRQLTASQRAWVAKDLLPFAETEARERQLATLKRGAVRPEVPVSAFLREREGKAAAAMGNLAGVSARYVTAAKRIEKEVPQEVGEKIRDGKLTLNKAEGDLRRQKQTAERKAVLEAIAIQPGGARRQVKAGDWWQLGDHLFYCGDTSQPEFIDHCPTAAFAFADPPYGVGKDDWDNELIWAHDWLADKAKIVVVTPGIANIHQFAGLTGMPYRWALAAYITNGKTRGAIGFSNWIYMGAYAKDKVFRQRQDATTISIHASETVESTHKSRKPAELLSWLLDTFTSEGDLVIDPFLGSGTTLLAAQAKGRRCVAGELEPTFVDEVIGRWEALTQQRAVKIELG